MARRTTFKTATISILVIAVALIGVSRVVTFRAWPPDSASTTDSAATPLPEVLVVPRQLTGATGAMQPGEAPLTLPPAAAPAMISVPALGRLQIPVQGVQARDRKSVV